MKTAQLMHRVKNRTHQRTDPEEPMIPESNRSMSVDTEKFDVLMINECERSVDCANFQG